MPVLTRPRATKQEARYTPAGGRERCADCRFFVSPNDCKRIIGPVSPRGWCKYFSQEAVAASRRPSGFVGGGGGGGAGIGDTSLDISFLNVATLDPRITFTRASTATYFNATGTMQTAAANVARFDSDPVTFASRGLLIEESRTNTWLQSADASNAAWQKGGQVVAAPVVTANQVIAPDGSLTAARVVYPAVAGATAFSVLYQVITTTTAAQSFSAWLKGSVGGEQIYVGMSGAGTVNPPRLTLTTQWQRYTFVSPALTAGGNAFSIGADLRDTSETSIPGCTVFVWGAQVEQGGFPTSYIPTAAASATRAADVATVASIPGRHATAESYNAEVLLLTTQNTNFAVLGDTAGGMRMIFMAGGASAGGTYDTAGALYTANSATLGIVAKIASTWSSPNNATICMNAGAVATSAALTNGFAGIAAMKLGGDVNAGEQMNGYMRRVRYWPRALSLGESGQVTS